MGAEGAAVQGVIERQQGREGEREWETLGLCEGGAEALGWVKAEGGG
jgi:hypothetical protein